MSGMRRREFVILLGGSAAAWWPLAARAQQQPVIGYLSARTPGDSVEVLAEFRRGLAETGFVEGQNLAIEYRWLVGRYNLLPEMIGDLVRRQVAVIAIPNTTSSVLAAKQPHRQFRSSSTSEAIRWRWASSQALATLERTSPASPCCKLP
jgi:hypothetical protein